MQYTTGTITIDSGTPTTVTGSGTKWLANVSANWVFKIQSEETIYEIQSITDDTTLIISPAYSGPPWPSGVAYVILRDYTPRYQWPLLLKGNVNWASVLSEALRRIDSDMYETPSCRYIKFDPLGASPANVEGTFYYDDSAKTFAYYAGAVLGWRQIMNEPLT